MLHERSVPHKAKNKGADNDSKHENKELGERVRLGFGLGNFFDHLLKVEIFF